MPVEPPLHADIPLASTASVSSRLLQEHKEDVEAYLLSIRLPTTFATSFLPLWTKHSCFRSITTPTGLLGQTTVLELLNHLTTIYGTAGEAEVKLLTEAMNQPRESGALECTIFQIKTNAEALEAAGSAVTNQTKIDILIQRGTMTSFHMVLKQRWLLTGLQ